MTQSTPATTYDKALALNLESRAYGTFAEIGAGQETANWFFRAPATAGTVAKTISAYDMTMSDAIYGHCERYVSRQRLEAMLNHEYGILIERLAPKRGEKSLFFSFCNTVRARAWRDNGECHGWLGIRYQMKPGDPPSDAILHVRLLDGRNSDQMDALGILGVNLIHAVFHHRGHLRRFVESLTDNLAPGRIEIDLLSFGGHGYGFFDNRLCALQLVESGLTEATMFLPTGEVVQPAEMLYRRPVLLMRGSFDPVLKLHLEMMSQARGVFEGQLEESERGRLVELCEITTHNLLRDAAGDPLDPVDFIDRADCLQALGKAVLLTQCAEFHRVAAVLNRCTTSPISILLSIGLLNELFKPKWSANLAGGLLESFGRLFKSRLSLLVFPWKNRHTGELVTADNFQPPADCRYLYEHLTSNGKILPVPCADEGLLRYTGRDLRKMIAGGDASWKDYVPETAHAVAARFDRTPRV